MREIERDISKFLILALYGAIIANVLTNGRVAVQIGGLFVDVIRAGFNAAGGRRV